MECIKVDFIEIFMRSFANPEHDTPQHETYKMLQDLNYTLSLEDGPWLAGGAVREYITNSIVKDFDFFFKNQEQFDNFKTHLFNIGYEVKYENEHNITMFCAETKYLIQLIKIKFFDTAEEVLDSFDFTICQFLTDGKKIMYPPFSMIDLFRKRLVVHKINYGVSTLKRIIKYTKKGYYLCGGATTALLQQIIDNPQSIQENIVYID